MNIIKIKDGIDVAMFYTFNIMSRIIFKFSSQRSEVKRNIVFKNKHKGDRCFILGTGPSLKDVDFDLLKNEIVFGVNYLYKYQEIEKLNINYYVMYDEVFYKDRKEDTFEALNLLKRTKFFMRTNAIEKMIVNDKAINERLFFQYCKQVQYENYLECDLTKNMTAPFNVLVAAIQIAMYMGFKNIYLLGADFNSFATKKNYHCYEELSNERSIRLAEELKFYSMVTYHHYALGKHSSNLGANIVNLTNNSLLDAYPFQDIGGVFNVADENASKNDRYE